MGVAGSNFKIKLPKFGKPKQQFALTLKFQGSSLKIVPATPISTFVNRFDNFESTCKRNC